MQIRIKPANAQPEQELARLLEPLLAWRNLQQPPADNPVRQVIMAPMEGVMDHRMRELLTALSPYDRCVTEFVRIVDQLLPSKVFYRYCPELANGGRTFAGTPVYIQLLGQHPQWMASNAIRAAELGAPGIDLNFGCPSKCVNGNQGGASLLKDPEQIFQIVKAVRDAVPSETPVTAKVRLGWQATSEIGEIANAAAEGGASELAIHARTRVDGYKPGTIRWDLVSPIQQKLDIPILINGEVVDLSSARQCIALSGCDRVMVGRGALSQPYLAGMLKQQQTRMPWEMLCELLRHFSGLELSSDKKAYFPNRLKQWLKYLKSDYPEADALFMQVRSLKNAGEICDVLSGAEKLSGVAEKRDVLI